jgi:DNA-directed RNA polymerase specialized sigma24 family protein
MPELKKNWVPTREAFRRFLEWLDEGVDSRGQRYLEMRLRLSVFFDRRDCLYPDDLADETLNRAARRLEEEGAIPDSPARYCYIVARFVFLESLRREKQDRKEAAEHPGPPASRAVAEAEADERHTLLEALERCLHGLSPSERDLILEYYRGEQRAKIEHRRELAARLGLTVNAVSIRACRTSLATAPPISPPRPIVVSRISECPWSPSITTGEPRAVRAPTTPFAIKPFAVNPEFEP